MTDGAVPRNLMHMAGTPGPPRPDPMQSAITALTALGMSVVESCPLADARPGRPGPGGRDGPTLASKRVLLRAGAGPGWRWGDGSPKRPASGLRTATRRARPISSRPSSGETCLHDGDFGPPRVLERQWMRSGLTPRWVCLCVAAGVQSPAEAEHLRERSRSEPSLEGELHLRGVVLRGADARSLTFVDPEGGLS